MSNFLYNFKSNVNGLTLEGEFLNNGKFIRGIKNGLEFTATLKIKNFTSQHRDIQFSAQRVVSKDGSSTTSTAGHDRKYIAPGVTTELTFTCTLPDSFGSASNEFIEIVILDMLNFTLPAPILKIRQERTLKVLNPAMSGYDVDCVQQKLNELKLISDNLTGYYDQATEQAVKTFQSSNGLSVDGQVGPNTWSKLFPYSVGVVEGAIGTATQWMIDLANDDSHGYDQTYRWGEYGDYDCSSAIITAWQTAGVSVKDNGATYTGNMKDVFTQCGFVDVIDSVNVSTGDGLEYGDVLLNHTYHTAMYIGNNQIVHARINENGTATGGEPGDQTGAEIRTQAYYNYTKGGWNSVLRYSA